MKTTKSDIRRFREKTTTSETGCVVWTAAKNPHGYGRFKPVCGETRMVLAHRWAYEHFVGPIPDGFVIDHLCRNASCVNPEHLDPVTQLVNVRRGAGNGAKTHCPAGHPYSEANVRVYRGMRYCRECQAIRNHSRFKKVI